MWLFPTLKVHKTLVGEGDLSKVNMQSGVVPEHLQRVVLYKLFTQSSSAFVSYLLRRDALKEVSLDGHKGHIYMFIQSKRDKIEIDRDI